MREEIILSLSTTRDLLAKTHVTLMEFQTELASHLRLSSSLVGPRVPYCYILEKDCPLTSRSSSTTDVRANI